MKILFLSTWFPFPHNQGSKVRAYYLLRSLAERHDVTLISFADTAIEPCAREHIEKFCRVEIVHQNPFAANPIRRWLGWLSSQPSSVWATYSYEMATRVRQVALEWKPDTLVALTASTARYALNIPGVQRIADIDSFLGRDLREEYAVKARWSRVRSWLAWRKMQRYERWLFSQFDLNVIASEQDRQSMMSLAGMLPQQIRVVPNGVDTVFNSPRNDKPEPNTLVYTGALTYVANYQAIDYFLKEIFPLIKARVPQIKLRITGKTDGVRLDRLHLNDAVVFTGYLDDVRPTVTSSSVCIVPLKRGGGTRLKVLEAMALGTPVVSTSKGVEGLDVQSGEHLLIADTPEDFAAQTIRLLLDSALAQRLGRNARRLVEQEYDWSRIGARFNDLIESIPKEKH